MNNTENTISEEFANVFSICDSIFAENLKEETNQALVEEATDVMWRDRAFYMDDPEWIRYVDGYKDAADRLVEKHEADFLVYPTMYLYRQYLELQLKSLLRKLYLYHGIQCSYPKTHDLEELWRRARPLIEELMEEVCPQETTDQNDCIEKRIEEFNLLDPDSSAFRFPEDRERRPSFEDVPKQGYHGMINLSQVKYIVGDMHEKLRGTDEYLCVMLQQNDDTESSWEQ